MKQSQSKWLLLTLGSTFWVALGAAGPIFKNVMGINDLSPTLFLALGIPLWIFAVSSTTRKNAVVGTIGGVVFAGTVSSVGLPLHVRALYWQDACESQDYESCFRLSSYYQDGHSWIGGFTDAQKYREMGLKLRGTPVKKAPVKTTQLRCLNAHDLSACSDWIDQGYYQESKIACQKVLRLCHDTSCQYDVMRCRNIVEPWPKKHP